MIPKRHTVKVLERKNGKICQVSITINGHEQILRVAKSGRVFDGNIEIGKIQRAKGRWFDNQFLIIFNNQP